LCRTGRQPGGGDRLTDVTALAVQVSRFVAEGDLAAAAALLPAETPYAVSEQVASRLGMTAG
jgi:hypothetical protein